MAKITSKGWASTAQSYFAPGPSLIAHDCPGTKKAGGALSSAGFFVCFQWCGKIRFRNCGKNPHFAEKPDPPFCVAEHGFSTTLRMIQPLAARDQARLFRIFESSFSVDGEQIRDPRRTDLSGLFFRFFLSKKDRSIVVINFAQESIDNGEF